MKILSLLLLILGFAFAMKRSCPERKGKPEAKKCKHDQTVVLSPAESTPFEIWAQILQHSNLDALLAVLLTSKTLHATLTHPPMIKLLYSIAIQSSGDLPKPSFYFLIKHTADITYVARLLARYPSQVRQAEERLSSLSPDERWIFSREFFAATEVTGERMESWRPVMVDRAYVDNLLIPVCLGGVDFLLARIITAFPRRLEFYTSSHKAISLLRCFQQPCMKARLAHTFYTLVYGFHTVATVNSRNYEMNQVYGMLAALRTTLTNEKALPAGTANFSSPDSLSQFPVEDFLTFTLPDLESIIFNNVSAGIWEVPDLKILLEHMLSSRKWAEDCVDKLAQAIKIVEIFSGRCYDFDPVAMTEFQVRLGNLMAGRSSSVPRGFAKVFWVSMDTMNPACLEFCLKQLYWNQTFQCGLMRELCHLINEPGNEDSEGCLISRLPSRNTQRWLAFNMLTTQSGHFTTLRNRIMTDLLGINWRCIGSPRVKLIRFLLELPDWRELLLLIMDSPQAEDHQETFQMIRTHLDLN